MNRRSASEIFNNQKETGEYNMFLESIKIIETTPCLAERKMFKIIARAGVDLSEMLPYLHRIIDKSNYQMIPHSLVFNYGRTHITLQESKISMTKVLNMTEGYEILDWIKDLVNDTFESKTEIEPNYNPTKLVGVLKIYSLLPKKNCKLCGESTCMAFAGKLNQYEAEIEECPLLLEPEFRSMKEKLENEFAD